MTDTHALLEKLKNASDFSKLQIHVILNYIPFTKDINETEPEDLKTNKIDDFIQSRIEDPDNRFNFTKKNNDKEFLLENHINHTELESLLPELNKYVTTNNPQNGGTRITKRVKKSPLSKRNKQHTARKYT